MQTIDEILSSQFARKAVETNLVQRNGRPCAANLLRELLEEISGLAQYCQLSEFTEHGLPHLGSIVNRIQTWSLVDDSLLLDGLNADETFLLFFAVLTHDIGMLTQREEDLTETDRLRFARDFAEMSSWVRRTHIHRLEGIIKRLFKDRYPEFLSSNLFSLGTSLARSHQYWPHQEGYQELGLLAKEGGFDPDRFKAMAGVLAIADLLDEDSSRCDTVTLFANKAGNLMNRAHWLRHLLTMDRLRVVRGVVTVQIQVPKNLDGKVDSAVEGLRNHLRLAQVYNTVLSPLRSQVTLCFPAPIPCDPVPQDSLLELLLCEPDVHLMRSLPDEALPGTTAIEPEGSCAEVMGVHLMRVDRTVFDYALGPVGNRSGRSDLEITYAAASLRGEDQRRCALRLLRSAAIEAHARGDITVIRRLSSLVIQDLTNNNRRDLTDTFWAAAFTIHWAHREHDLISIEFLLEGMAENVPVPNIQCMNEVIGKLPIKWQVQAMTIHMLLMRRQISWEELNTLIERCLEFPEVPLSPEEHIAWHDLVEALWAMGYLAKDVPDIFITQLTRFQELEKNLPLSQQILTKLKWRMTTQSRCLTGYGRWEATADSLAWGDGDNDFMPDPGREAIAQVWNTWFNGSNNDLKEVARESRKSNPPGSEFYISALEAEWLVTNIGIEARLADDDALHRRYEFTDATERDDAYRLINSIVTALLDVSMSPKEEGTIYFGGRGAEFHRCEVLLGERIALRRWYLGSWHKVVGYHLRSSLSLAHTMYLEGDQVVQPVLDGIVDLPWGIPYAGKSKDLLATLFPRIESRITPEQLTPLLESIVKSSRRISNIHHPGLMILSDALTPEMLPVLVEWTVRELRDPTAPLWPATFEVWPVLFRYASISPETWQALTPLIEHSFKHIYPGKINYEIVEMTIVQAPWSVVGPLIRRITDALQSTDSNTEWLKAAKNAVGNGLLRRQNEEWSKSEEYQLFIALLKDPVAMNKGPNDPIILEFLSRPKPIEGYDLIAERWLECLEEIRDCALSRESSSGYSFGISGYPVGQSRPINDEMAKRAARALDELWSAENAITEEIEQGTEVAGYLFRASSGTGQEVLAKTLLSVMASRRTAIGFNGSEECSAIAWRSIANHSAHFPISFLTELGDILMDRLIELPIEVSWTQARIATELFLRSKKLEEQKLAESALLVIRARTLEQLRWSGQAVVASIKRILEEENWLPATEDILDLLLPWVEDAATAPVSHIRESVALFCSKLANRVTVKHRERLTEILNHLRKDVLMRVRNAAGVAED